MACVYSQSSSVSLEIFDYQFEFPHIKFSISCTLMYKVTIRQLEACGGSLYFSLISGVGLSFDISSRLPLNCCITGRVTYGLPLATKLLDRKSECNKFDGTSKHLYLSYITLGTFSNFLKFILSSFPELRLALFKKNQFHRNAMNGMYEGTSEIMSVWILLIYKRPM